MESIDLIRSNLFSPFFLAFLLGVLAVAIKSDLKFPEGLSTGLSIYLLLAIGLKGGGELSSVPLSEIWRSIVAVLILGSFTPLFAFAIARWIGRLDRINAGAIAAHYGSVSAVTFSATIAFLDSRQIWYEAFMPTLLVLLEIPAILIAIAIARVGSSGQFWPALREVVTGRSVVLLGGGLVIGALAGKPGLAPVAPLFVAPFAGALVLLLLEMGLIAAARLKSIGSSAPFIIGFGVAVPIIHGVFGVWLGNVVGLSLGGATLLGVLAASASYIAAPAAVRVALPLANPGLYLTPAVAISFPFNIAIGIPLYFAVSQAFHIPR